MLNDNPIHESDHKVTQVPTKRSEPKILPPTLPMAATSGTLNLNDYKILSTLAESFASKVYKVKLVKPPNTLFVLKKIKTEAPENEERAKKELEMFQKFRHARIVNLVDFCSGSFNGEQETNFLLTYYPQSVPQIIYSGQGYPKCSFTDRNVVVKILRQVAEALTFIHSQGFRHGDVRPGHILLNEHYDAFLTDFESIQPLEKEIKHLDDFSSVTDPKYEKDPYRAPEIYRPKVGIYIDGKADVWSFGCVIYYLLFSKSPFKDPEHGVNVENIIAGKYDVPEHNWPNVYMETLTKCLTVPLEGRITFPELKQRLDSWPAPPEVAFEAPLPPAPTREEEQKGGNCVIN